ncbi:hypothetical protein [Shinella zoogloeoides]|uniref:hypothetical protein n=1 Tax=Shinella zoogloeoides TaxID=352475 RepID=UPI00299EB14B|nr:hypothetical protein [Shinella zoogloeoides]
MTVLSGYPATCRDRDALAHPDCEAQPDLVLLFPGHPECPAAHQAVVIERSPAWIEA